MAQVALERPPRSPSGDLELSTSETAARRFCLLYDCVRNKYWRPFDLQAGPHHDWGNLCSAQENMFRKVENDHHQSYLCRLPTKTRSWISWRISHKGLSVQSVELVLSGIRTFSADAQVKPMLRCGDHSPWPVFIHPADKQDGGNGTGGIGRLRVEDIGPADFTELRVDFEGGAGEYNEWQHSQLFRTTNHSPNKQNLFLLIRFTEADDDDIIRADFNADQMMACRLMSNFSFTGNKYRRVGEAGRAELAGIGRVAAAAAAAEGRRRRVVDPRREAYLQRLADMGAIRRFAAVEGGRRRPNPNPNPNDDLAQPRRGEDRENGETQEDKRAAFADVALRELCLRTRRERMEVARCVERKLERGKRIVDLFSEALDAAEGSRTPLLEALFPPHYEDFCLVAINLLHFQLRVQRKEDGNSVSRNLTEQFSKGQYHWNVEYVDNETGRPQFSPRRRTVRPYDEWNNDLGGGWDNLGNNGWGNANFGNPAGFYPQHGNARLALVEAAAVMGYGLEESPLPFKFTCRSGSLQPENHMLEILIIRDVADGPGGEKQKMLKKFRVRPAHDGSIILDSSRVQQQADLQCPTAEPFDMQEGIDCLIQIRVLESRRNFTDFKFDEKGEGTSTSSAAVAVAPDTHMSVTGVLNVSGTRLYVSKELLHLVSPFFFKLFTQEFAEKGLNEVQLHGLNAAEVEDFLLVVSSRLSAKPVHPNSQNMAALLELAEYFDVPFLTQELGHLFPVFAEIPMHIRLTLAVRYRLTEVKDSLIDSELGEESALLCQRLLLPKLGGQKERELVLDGYLQGKSNKAILKEMLASCM